MKQIHRSLILCFATWCTVIIGCGGGSSGTGTRGINGIMSSDTGAVLSGVTLTDIISGESTKTDDQGHFALEVPDTATSVTLEVSDPDAQLTASDGSQINLRSNTVTIPLGSDTSQAVSVKVTASASSGRVQAQQYSYSTKIEGVCDAYFDNPDKKRSVIRQSNNLPNKGITCPVRVRAKKNGTAINHVAFAVIDTGCDQDNQEKIVATGVTGNVGPRGLGEVSFQYIDSPEHCFEVAILGEGAASPLLGWSNPVTSEISRTIVESFSMAKKSGKAAEITPLPTETIKSGTVTPTLTAPTQTAIATGTPTPSANTTAAATMTPTIDAKR